LENLVGLFWISRRHVSVIRVIIVQTTRIMIMTTPNSNLPTTARIIAIKPIPPLSVPNNEKHDVARYTITHFILLHFLIHVCRLIQKSAPCKKTHNDPHTPMIKTTMMIPQTKYKKNKINVKPRIHYLKTRERNIFNKRIQCDNTFLSSPD